MKLRTLLLTISMLAFPVFHACDSDQPREEISKAFEFRYVSEDTAANGITDLKGPTAVFDLAGRLDYLGKFTDYGRHFFDDPGLNTKVVMKEAVDSALRRLKPQPQPEIRQEIAIDQWKYLGYKEGQREKELQEINEWRQMAGVEIKDEALVLSGNKISRQIPAQDWRMKFSWKVKPLEKKQDVAFDFSGVAEVGLSKDGSFYYVTEGNKTKAEEYQSG
ncbi:MAG: hypothetical protein KGY70_14005, partial [Bacteroidales bacterium]|nr:hypothetical protein [Bacteroidales bacterium]